MNIFPKYKVISRLDTKFHLNCFAEVRTGGSSKGVDWSLNRPQPPERTASRPTNLQYPGPSSQHPVFPGPSSYHPPYPGSRGQPSSHVSSHSAPSGSVVSYVLTIIAVAYMYMLEILFIEKSNLMKKLIYKMHNVWQKHAM